MSFGFLEVAITPAVRAVQEELGVAHIWADFQGRREFNRFTETEAAHIVSRESFYMATTSETGWPYVQHRGGPRGFLKVLDDQTLAFADYRGNFQYISIGNMSVNNKACLFLMDYPSRTRLKIYVHVDVLPLDADTVLTEKVLDPTVGRAERIIRFRLQNFDWNCSKHIVPRFTQAELEATLQPIRQRIDLLEAENSRLRSKLAGGGLDDLPLSI